MDLVTDGESLFLAVKGHNQFGANKELPLGTIDFRLIFAYFILGPGHPFSYTLQGFPSDLETGVMERTAPRGFPLVLPPVPWQYPSQIPLQS